MYYIRICKGLADKGKLIPATESIYDHTTRNTDWYRSLFLYNEEQKAIFDSRGSVAGLTDLVTNRVFLDFDSPNDLNASRSDALEAIHRIKNLGILEDNIEVYFSGKKGFSVELTLDTYLNPEQYDALHTNLTEGLSTADTVVTNPSRVIRVLLTTHQETGLLKFPLTVKRFISSSVDEIKELATSIDNVEDPENFIWEPVSISPDLYKVVIKPKVETKQVSGLDINNLDMGKKPKFMDAARWALQNGYFQEGERSNALTCLAATWKNFGFNEEVTYRYLKGVAETQSNLTGMERFPDVEIYNNIIGTVFGPHWKGGQYSLVDKTSWLYKYAEKYKLLDKIVSDERHSPKTLTEVKDTFKHYVNNIDKNTIKTGIKSLDQEVFLSTGASVMVVGAPSSGKTAWALNVLENTSQAGIKSVFASLDMHRNRLFEKVMYKISGKKREDLYATFKENKEADLMKELDQRYGNCYFYDKSAATIDDIRDYILECEKKSGEKVKLVMLDYFERVNSERSEDTAASKDIASKIQDLVNDLDVCVITLVQPNKFSLGGDASNPITSYTSIKGSAFMYQSARIILSIWRPFFNIKHSHDDRYMSMGILKNDLGEIGQLDYHWDGKRGEIRELEDFERNELESLLESKDNEDEESDDDYVKRWKQRT